MMGVDCGGLNRFEAVSVTCVFFCWRRLTYSQITAFDMKIPLGKRNVDAMLLERLPDHEVEFTPQHTRGGGILPGPDAQDEIERTVSKLVEQRVCPRVLQHAGMLAGDLNQQPSDKLRVRSV